MLAEIYSWFTEGFETLDLRDAKALLEELAQALCHSKQGLIATWEVSLGSIWSIPITLQLQGHANHGASHRTTEWASDGILQQHQAEQQA
jgi:hypothetical protein